MTIRDPNKVVVGFDRAENTQTISSPHTYAFSAPGTTIPSTVRSDAPVISNVSIRSAVAGIHAKPFSTSSLSSQPQSGKVSKNVSAVKRQVQIKQERYEQQQQQQQQQKALRVQGNTVQTSKQLHHSSSENHNNNCASTTRRVQTLSFDMSHTSPPVANMLRRLMSTEVPTLAFDRVLIEANDSVVLDELLSHRLGLVPIAGPVHEMEYITQSNQVSFDNLDPNRVLVFEMNVQGQKQLPVTPIYSNALKWVPLPGQQRWKWTDGKTNTKKESNAQIPVQKEEEEENGSNVFLVHPDILITKLGPYQQLKLRAIAIKGLGIVHAKWSPVSSCYYEMKTSVSFQKPITGQDAVRVIQTCPSNVFQVDANNTLQVCDVKRCQLARDILRREGLQQLAQLIVIEKDKTAVRFHVESVGQLYAAQIVRAALQLFAERCRDLAQLIQSTQVNVVDKQHLPH